LEFAFATFAIFGFEPRLELSTRPEKRLGTDAQWDHAESALVAALEHQGLTYTVTPGDGAFYGPKIDMHVTDSMSRSWQLGTVQLDYQMPERFGLTYTGADNAEHQPVMIHRALMGSYERFIGILIEHLEGELPVWLTPVQAILLPIADRHLPYCREVLSTLAGAGVRAELDDRTESVGRKIRDAELRKIPYMLVVGDREADGGEVSVREHRGGDIGSVPAAAFAERIANESRKRADGA
jgi:threonyl-tRNA synthetase